jgi:hypothetical protein
MGHGSAIIKKLLAQHEKPFVAIMVTWIAIYMPSSPSFFWGGGSTPWRHGKLAKPSHQKAPEISWNQGSELPNATIVPQSNVIAVTFPPPLFVEANGKSLMNADHLSPGTLPQRRSDGAGTCVPAKEIPICTETEAWRAMCTLLASCPWDFSAGSRPEQALEPSYQNVLEKILRITDQSHPTLQWSHEAM